MKTWPITVKDVLDSDGEHPTLRLEASDTQRINASVLVDRVNALAYDLGFKAGDERPAISDGLRSVRATYGAAKSAHKEGKALDLVDVGHKFATRCTKAMLLKHQLRREDTDATPTWCHLDIRDPHGTVFMP